MTLFDSYTQQNPTPAPQTHVYQEESNSSKHCCPRSKQPWSINRLFTTNVSDYNTYQPLFNTKFYAWPPLWTRPTRLLLPLSNDQTHLHPPGNPRQPHPHLLPSDPRYDYMKDHINHNITNYRNSHSQYDSSTLPQQHHTHTVPNTPINHLNAPDHTQDTQDKSTSCGPETSFRPHITTSHCQT